MILLAAAVGWASCSASGNAERGADTVSPGPTSAAMDAAVRTITAEDFARRVGVLADDSMGGRATPSPGLDAAAAWVASELESMGLRGALEGGAFIQRYPLDRAGATGAVGSVTAPNVVAVLDGRDPVLRSEYVVFSAHIDHIGTGPPDENGDTIFNGADDDASGTTALLEAAEAAVSLAVRPRRSLMFVFVSGEENGLWGSEWFTANPPVPIDSMVADLNADMVGRNWTDTIVVIGKEHSDLGRTVDEVAAAHPELGLAVIDDLWPDERFFFRSDHYNFARRGIPSVFVFNGTHDDYHGRDDEPDRIDAEKGARVAALLFRIGMAVAERPDPPRWDRSSYNEIVRGR